MINFDANINMISTILPFAYFPNISWYYFFLTKENVQIEMHENFVKQSYRNRTEISGPNGILNLMIPLKHRKQEHIQIGEVEISYESNWQKIHWNSLESSYRRSAYFEFYEPYFKKIFENKYEKLVDLNLEVLKILNRLLKVDKELIFTDEYRPIKKEEDLRVMLHPRLKGLLQQEEYYQLFSHKYGFKSNMSILDLLFTKGPDSIAFIMRNVNLI